MSESARRSMLRARSELVLDHPFFARLALRLELREDPECRTAWSDGEVLAYNPQYIASLTPARIKGLQCHEVLHLACCHHTRRAGRDKATWNMACDHAINHVLLEAGLELPPGHLDDPRYRGRSAETIYALLRNDGDARLGADSDQLQELGAMDSAEGAGGAVRNGGDDTAAEAVEARQDAEGLQGPAAGSDADGSDDQEEHDPGMCGEVRDAATARDGDGRQSQEDAWSLAAAQALNEAREAGSLPGGLERLLGRQQPSTLAWGELLRRFLSGSARDDFSWVRPNLRYLHAGLYLPGLDNRSLTDIAVAVDVSGSVSQGQLDAFAAELSAILEEFDATLDVLTCDAALTTRRSFTRQDLPLGFTATGGGGTDFRPPFLELLDDPLLPACLVYFTDLECDSFPEVPAFPVLWVTPNADHGAPPFGEVVIMECGA